MSYKTCNKTILIILTIFTILMTDTYAQNASTTASTNVLDWINALNSPGSAPCPIEMRSTLKQCYVRNNSEAENIQPLCEHLIMKSSVSSNRSSKVCASLSRTCKAPAVIVFNKAVASGITTYQISCQMYDASVIASANDGVAYGLNCHYTPAGMEYFGTLDKTASGVTCERWDAGLPHMEAITFGTDFFAEKVTSLSQLGNKCRNYIRNTGLPLNPKQSKPWCYTATSWELCNPPICADVAASRPCKSTSHGIDYNGNVNMTNGTLCVSWHYYAAYFNAGLFVDGSAVAAGSNCRNIINNDKGIACFILVWENAVQTPYLTPCNIPDC